MPLKPIFVCKTDAIPKGEMRCVELSDRNVLVAHTDSGFRVSDEMCTHEDARLCDGNLSGELVKCPLHGSRFDLVTGSVLDDPATEDLRIYTVTIDESSIYVDIDDSEFL
ncbi:MAG: non-heme iron oxygenase ferredoxin subunit [Gammaproteobacteria bacterium]|nr:non-heme iron oxygenase ferredoxin subunit [Gammaproteobacteria bacterium]